MKAGRKEGRKDDDDEDEDEDEDEEEEEEEEMGGILPFFGGLLLGFVAGVWDKQNRSRKAKKQKSRKAKKESRKAKKSKKAKRLRKQATKQRKAKSKSNLWSRYMYVCVRSLFRSVPGPLLFFSERDEKLSRGGLLSMMRVHTLSRHSIKPLFKKKWTHFELCILIFQIQQSIYNTYMPSRQNIGSTTLEMYFLLVYKVRILVAYMNVIHHKVKQKQTFFTRCIKKKLNEMSSFPLQSPTQCSWEVICF